MAFWRFSVENNLSNGVHVALESLSCSFLVSSKLLPDIRLCSLVK